LKKHGGVNVTAADDCDGVPCRGKLISMEEPGGGRNGSARLCNEVGVPDDVSHGEEDFVFRDGDNRINIGAEVGEIVFADLLRAEAVGESAGSLGRGPGDTLVGTEAFRRVGGKFGLDSNDANIRASQFDGSSDAAQETASANRREDEVYLGELLEDFGAAGRLSGNDVGMVEGRHDGVAVFGSESFGAFAAFFTRRADGDDFGA
jgi:hypothetical protein